MVPRRPEACSVRADLGSWLGGHALRAIPGERGKGADGHDDDENQGDAGDEAHETGQEAVCDRPRGSGVMGASGERASLCTG